MFVYDSAIENVPRGIIAHRPSSVAVVRDPDLPEASAHGSHTDCAEVLTCDPP